ncbi:hypothetical protein [Amycolatopsis vancoresmycina]|uniref:CDP-glycerol:poly(Glycerophosphate) glycerophosphotransferase n=1 Tax=Amycolatopsis vancoresmycina DSM 44592 TaxID=1292037 RepID=R1FY58_9PSEU|nr:hypothetical protein [Amycolatopsis vancoresmycina]EOD64293.1 hypothetical protein H480_32568 [Amycolatopsis vancoresmycina DSM 44592]
MALTRLEDLVPLLESDHRTQRVHAVPDDGEDRPDAAERIRARGEVLLSMQQARQDTHGLVLAASSRGLEAVRGPALLVAHGGALGQYRPWRTAADGDLVTGLHPGQLVRDGRVRPDRIALAHERELDVLARFCPEAVPHAVVAGDIAFDRLVATTEHRERHRRALGVTDDREVLLVTSTWSPRSGFGRNPELFREIVEAAPPDRFRVVASLHPQIWSHHGRGQVLGWLSDALDAGLAVLAPHTDWRGAVAAADHVLADYTSVGTFAAGLGTPVLRIPHEPQPMLAGSPAAVLAEHAPLWDVTRPLLPQLDAAAGAQDRGLGARIAGLLTSRPGQAGTILRKEMYELLGLSEPARAVPLSPAPLPAVVSRMCG